MREDHIREFLGKLFTGIHVVKAGGKNDLASILYTFSDSLFRLCRICIRNIVLADDLAVFQSQFVLHFHNTLVVCICVSGTLCRVRNMDNTNLQVFFGNRCKLAGAFRLAFICFVILLVRIVRFVRIGIFCLGFFFFGFFLLVFRSLLLSAACQHCADHCQRQYDT